MNSVTQPTEPPAAATALRACADLAETAVCLARLAGTAAQADFCGVFLLDYTGTELLLRAVWHAGAGASAPRGHSLPLGSQDPVCFSLQTGTEYTVRDGMQNAASRPCRCPPGEIAPWAACCWALAGTVPRRLIRSRSAIWARFCWKPTFNGKKRICYCTA